MARRIEKIILARTHETNHSPTHKIARERTTPNLKARKPILVFWATFSPVRRGLFPVVRDFLCIIPTEQVLYYRNLGLYYGLASGTLPLYSGPCLGVKGGCVSCDKTLEIFILGLQFSFSLENFNPGPCFSAARGGLGMKRPFSIENFIPD